jgi:predicted lipoprotein with Yx(FWY)xxD motif
MKNTIYRMVVASSLVAIVACGTSTGPNPNVASRNDASIGLSNGHLVDASGFAVYDTPAACTGTCLTVWPPLMASAVPAAMAGVNQASLGLSAGQVTYNGHLLFYFQTDTSPGQIGGSGVNGFVLVAP